MFASPCRRDEADSAAPVMRLEVAEDFTPDPRHLVERGFVSRIVRHRVGIFRRRKWTAADSARRPCFKRLPCRSRHWRQPMNRLTIAILLGTSLAAFGCSKEEQASSSRVSAEAVRKDTRQAVGTATQFIEQEKDEFVRAAQHEIDQLKDALARLKIQAKSATGEARDKLDAQAARIEPQLQAAEARLAELKAASAEKWRETKEVLARQLDQLKQSFDQEQHERKAG
jgi:hypothetical protein